MTQQLNIIKPDDWHCHLRDTQVLQYTVPIMAKQFARAIVMPNLVPAVTTVAAAHAYRDRIMAAVAPGQQFTPLMTLYLTDQTTPEEIALAAASPYIYACKLYPAGATTNSAAGVNAIHRLNNVFNTMQQCDLPLLIHGEVTDHHVDIFARESYFITDILDPLRQLYPTLRIVLEHISTADAAEYIRRCPTHTAATITAHHLALNRNDLLVGGLKPHYYCLPIIKTQQDQLALIEAATSGDPRFFLGTDSAPHARHKKESSCGCAGIFTAPVALPIYASIFEEAGKLSALEAFASFYGADFYGLPRNNERITLTATPWQVPDSFPFVEGNIIPYAAGQHLRWQVLESTP